MAWQAQALFLGSSNISVLALVVHMLCGRVMVNGQAHSCVVFTLRARGWHRLLHRLFTYLLPGGSTALWKDSLQWYLRMSVLCMSLGCLKKWFSFCLSLKAYLKGILMSIVTASACSSLELEKHCGFVTLKKNRKSR